MLNCRRFLIVACHIVCLIVVISALLPLCFGNLDLATPISSDPNRHQYILDLNMKRGECRLELTKTSLPGHHTQITRFVEGGGHLCETTNWFQEPGFNGSRLSHSIEDVFANCPFSPAVKMTVQPYCFFRGGLDSRSGRMDDFTTRSYVFYFSHLELLLCAFAGIAVAARLRHSSRSRRMAAFPVITKAML